MERELVLASGSPRRKKILRELNIKFKIKKSNIKEISSYLRPSDISKDLAYKKALSVASILKEGIVLGFDTIVFCDREVIGKPKNLKDAKRILRKITKHVNIVYTGIAIINLYNNKILKDYEVTKVYMRKFSKSEIDKFALKHMDKAGAYGIQDKNDRMVRKISGDYYNVVGLPAEKLKKMLKKMNYLF